jgi:hypothetical protein
LYKQQLEVLEKVVTYAFILQQRYIVQMRSRVSQTSTGFKDSTSSIRSKISETAVRLPVTSTDATSLALLHGLLVFNYVRLTELCDWNSNKSTFNPHSSLISNLINAVCQQRPRKCHHLIPTSSTVLRDLVLCSC